MKTELSTIYRDHDEMLHEDLIYAAEHIPAEKLHGKNFFVTGATGLIGAQIIKTLLYCNNIRGSNIKIFALIRNHDKAKRIFGDMYNCEELTFVTGDVLSDIDIKENIDFVIHGASPTSSRYFVSNPVETIMTAVEGTRNMLEFSRQKDVEGFIYTSSLEVYGVPEAGKETVTEKDYGYLDPTQIRSSYSEGKRMAECLIASYASEYGVNARIARLSQTFGPGVDYNDGRVFAEFARSAVEGRDIVLHTEGRTVRTYCYTRDAVTAIIDILVNGRAGEAYNVTNMETKCSIMEMAEMVAGLFPEKNIKVIKDIPADSAALGYNPEMVIVLDNSKLRELGWEAGTDLREMFMRMIHSMCSGK